METAVNSTLSKLKTAARVFRYVKPYSLEYTLSMLFFSGQTFILGLLMALFANWLSVAMLAADLLAVFQALAYFLGISIVLWCLIGWGARSHSLCVEKARRDFKVELFRGFVRTSSEQQNGHSAKGIAALNTEANQACMVFGSALFRFLMNFVAIAFSAVVIFMIDLRLGAVSLLVGGIGLFIQYRFAAPMGELQKTRLETNASAVTRISNYLRGAASIRAFSYQEKELQDFDVCNEELRQLTFREAAIHTYQSIFSSLQSWLATITVFGFGGYLVATEQLTIPALLMVPVLSASIAQGMSGIGMAWAGLQGPLAACNRLVPILQQEEAMRLQNLAAERQAYAWNGEYHLSLKSVSFAYQGAAKNALNSVDLTIEPDQMVAFVGRSGCGKSTMLKLIIGLFERSELQLSLGSLDYGKVPLKEWRSKFAYVDQSSTLFNMTIAENIALGKPGCTQDEVQQAAREAGAAEFIESLPQGYDTLCGEGGGALSGSQKQRIAIARALVRQAPVLVFDEATSMLDSESGRQLMETIATLRKKHTVLIVTHNLEQIQDADRIIVLKDGFLVEDGSHEALLSLNGEYAALLQQEV